MKTGITCKSRCAIRAARGRKNKTWRGHKLPSKQFIRLTVSRFIIRAVIAKAEGKA